MRTRAEIEATAKSNFNAAALELLADIRELLQFLATQAMKASAPKEESDGGAI